MQRGDYFIVKGYSRELMTKLGNAARNWSNGKNYGYKFTLKKEKESIKI